MSGRRAQLLTRIENAVGILQLRDKGVRLEANVTDEMLVKSILLDAAALLDEVTP